MSSKLDRSSTGVIVAHPGTQHSYETALAVQEAGLLRHYLTGFYYDSDSALGRGLRFLPAKLRSRIERELYRRHKDGLDPALVQTFAAAELLYVAASRLGPFRRYSRDVIRWRNERFDGLVSRVVARERPGALICYNGCALKAFDKAKSLRIPCILDQSIAHIRTGLKLLREEAGLNPDFADSLKVVSPNWLVERSSQEATMADRVLAGSEYVKRSLLENGVDPLRISVVPYGVDSERFHPVHRPNNGIFRLLFVGQISQRKGIKYLLEAVKQLNLPGMELMLIGGVVGTGKGLAAYRDYFTHVPNVPHHEVHTYFQKGDVFVYPSLYEGSATAIYEALASGLPVITTPNSGSVVRDGVDGFVVAIRDMEAFKEKILLLYEDRELRKEMGREARKRAREFTWEAYRRRIRGVLGEILDLPADGASSELAGTGVS